MNNAQDSRAQAELSQQYQMLLTASQFLTTIQNVALYSESLAQYDTGALSELIAQYENSPKSLSVAQHRELQNLLAGLRAEIEATDGYVHTANIRRLFETIGMPDPAALERVICYYLTKAHKTAADRDKIDLLITRWGAFRIPGSDRMVVLRRESSLEEKLTRIFEILALEQSVAPSEAEVIAWLENFRDALLDVRKMSEIVEQNYKTKLREYKSQLGDLFYRPAVLAAIVEVNVTLHNVLQEFYLSERARLEVYVDQVKRKDDAREPASPLFSLMSRAEEMRRVIDETHAAIISQQVVDQADSTPGGEVDKLIALLEQTLQRSNELSEQIQRELLKRREQQ